MIDFILWVWIGVAVLGTLTTVSKVNPQRDPSSPAIAAIVVVMNVVFVWALATKLVQGG